METDIRYLNVSDIQHFSVGDGDGIRTTLFLKGCNLRCPWCHNPETISAKAQTLTYAENRKSVTYGRKMTAEELLPLLTRDLEFYRQSGGGVTVSGGEPLLQSKALRGLLMMLKESGVHTVIDTAGCVPFENFEDVLEFTDIFFVDVKSHDPAVYSDTVGGSLELVTDNIRELIKRNKAVRVRIPVIPGISDSLSDAEALRLTVLATGAERVDLLPFHRLGSGKYRALGLDYAYADTQPIPRQRIEALSRIFEQSFTVTIEK